jgi:HEPN domain-containing protein
MKYLTNKMILTMNNQPIKLTEVQRKELQEIAIALTTHYKIEKIICFAAISSLSTSDTIFTPPEATSSSAYYLLVMTTETTRIEHSMQDCIGTLFPGTYVIAHGLETVMNSVSHHDNFFLSACLNGALIYTSDGVTMIPEFEVEKAEQGALKDKEAFDRIYKLAEGFLESAFVCYENNFYNNVIFLLHQAVEQGCRALIRLFTGYRSDIHNISRLLEFCNCFSQEPALIFRRHFATEKKLFTILSNSYSHARYKDNYEVVDTDANELCTQVKAFLDLVAQLAKRNPHKGAAKDAAEVSAEVVDYSPALPASL